MSRSVPRPWCIAVWPTEESYQTCWFRYIAMSLGLQLPHKVGGKEVYLCIQGVISLYWQLVISGLGQSGFEDLCRGTAGNSATSCHQWKCGLILSLGHYLLSFAWEIDFCYLRIRAPRVRCCFSSKKVEIFRESKVCFCSSSSSEVVRRRLMAHY